MVTDLAVNQMIVFKIHTHAYKHVVQTHTNKTLLFILSCLLSVFGRILSHVPLLLLTGGTAADTSVLPDGSRATGS